MVQLIFQEHTWWIWYTTIMVSHYGSNWELAKKAVVLAYQEEVCATWKISNDQMVQPTNPIPILKSLPYGIKINKRNRVLPVSLSCNKFPVVRDPKMILHQTHEFYYSKGASRPFITLLFPPLFSLDNILIEPCTGAS